MPIQTGSLTLDEEAKILSAASESVSLDPIQAKILAVLMRYPGRAISRPEMENRVWGHALPFMDRRLDVHICHLRQKLECLPTPAEIRTMRGVGHRLVVGDE